MRAYWSDMVDRSAATAAQAAVLSVGVESVSANAFAVDWRLMAGMAAGGAVLSALTTIGRHGLSGRLDPDFRRRLDE